MNLKKITSGLLILSCVIVATACKKPEPNLEPTIDSETETALDAVWATYVVSDIEQICAFMGENTLNHHFYTEAAGSSGTFVPIRDESAEYINFAWNNTTCLDGRFRSGTILMNYKSDPVTNPRANENANYYRDYGYVGRITLSEYKVDNWLVKLYDDFAPAYVYNLAPNGQWDPKKTNLTWRFAGKFLLVHPTDSSRNIIWDGELIKELTNTADVKVFPNKLTAINWPLAQVKYSGHVYGSTHKQGRVSNSNIGKPFQMMIEQPNALWRDFTCYPDKISSVAPTTTAGVVTQRFNEHHPFVKGIASFTTGTSEDKIYPRQIYFGNEGRVELNSSCDNVGEILIKGISYKVNFRD